MTSFIKNIPLNSSWETVLKTELEQPYIEALSERLEIAYKNTRCFPEQENIFAALNLCPWSEVKVVILGQDPYHGEGQAQGLSFSVPKGMKLPPSLKNIFKEIHRDIKQEAPLSGDLSHWAKQGVLLLNACLTVEEGKAGSHRKWGWEKFTDSLIAKVQEKRESVVFLLWGNDAIKKAKSIDSSKHLILTSVHPSPLSAYRGFIGNAHFSKTNEFLKKKGHKAIQW